MGWLENNCMDIQFIEWGDAVNGGWSDGCSDAQDLFEGPAPAFLLALERSFSADGRQAMY